MRRKYSVSEINQMRGWVRALAPLLDEQAIESRLQTYMMNGTTPDELFGVVVHVTATTQAETRVIPHNHA